MCSLNSNCHFFFLPIVSSLKFCFWLSLMLLCNLCESGLVTAAQGSQSRAEKGPEKGNFNNLAEGDEKDYYFSCRKLALRRNTIKCL